MQVPEFGAPGPLISTETAEEFEAVRRRFFEDMKPSGIVEETLVYHAAATAWRLRRLPFLESILIENLRHTRQGWKELHFLSAHETRLMRTLLQIRRELQNRRKAAAVPPRPETAARPASRPPEPARPAAFGFEAATAEGVPSPVSGGSSPPA